MNPDQLRALFQQNKKALFAVAAVGVGGFALYKRHTAGATAGSATSSTSSSAGVVPSYSSGGQTTTMGGASGIYDSTSTDLASFLSPQLGAMQSQLNALTAAPSSSSTPTPVAGPIASSLLAPKGTGTYVINGNGTIGEVESDGSIFGMTLPQWMPLYDAGARPAATVDNALPMSTLGGNIAAMQAAIPVPAAASSSGK